MSLFRKTTATAPVPASTGQGPAINLDKVPAGLANLTKTAAISLEKKGLTGQRAAVYLVLDRSGSMRNYYRDGSVQNLAEQALGLSANLDDDGTVPVMFFSTTLDGTTEVSLDHYAGEVNRAHERLGHMGITNYALAMKAVIDHYRGSRSTAPAFVIFQTDGAPTDKAITEHVMRDASTLPIFWQFIGFGDDRFDFLRKLDDLRGRAVDNAGFFAAGRDPRAMSDGDLYDQLMAEYPQWLAAATAAGIVR